MLGIPLSVALTCSIRFRILESDEIGNQPATLFVYILSAMQYREKALCMIAHSAVASTLAGACAGGRPPLRLAVPAASQSGSVKHNPRSVRLRALARPSTRTENADVGRLAGERPEHREQSTREPAPPCSRSSTERLARTNRTLCGGPQCKPVTIDASGKHARVDTRPRTSDELAGIPQIMEGRLPPRSTVRIPCKNGPGFRCAAPPAFVAEVKQLLRSDVGLYLDRNAVASTGKFVAIAPGRAHHVPKILSLHAAQGLAGFLRHHGACPDRVAKMRSSICRLCKVKHHADSLGNAAREVFARNHIGKDLSRLARVDTTGTCTAKLVHFNKSEHGSCARDDSGSRASDDGMVTSEDSIRFDQRVTRHVTGLVGDGTRASDTLATAGIDASAPIGGLAGSLSVQVSRHSDATRLIPCQATIATNGSQTPTRFRDDRSHRNNRKLELLTPRTSSKVEFEYVNEVR